MMFPILLAGTLIVIPSVLLSYLWFKFWKLRKHFIIRARFPYITLSASISMFISGCCDCIIALLLYSMNINDPYTQEFHSSHHVSVAYLTLLSIANVSAFTFCVLIVWRTVLLVELWKMTTITLDEKHNIILAMDLYQVSNYGSSFCHRIICHLFTFLVINVAICAPLSTSSTGSTALIPTYLFMSSWLTIIAVGVVVLFKARRV
eukprot:245277_1